ncbi:hypothetical protein [Cupriavidus gilardii]|uniref:hypothetical protein n=1 Tax=Cupriavidus gilardii TaxID=82541 RepID=UPI0021B1E8FC|nr:hypothetical protein [Cupriavidus gilardii]UXC37099.1 hypothetical protein N4G38_06520 [Cupriavidus gilardii]
MSERFEGGKADDERKWQFIAESNMVPLSEALSRFWVKPEDLARHLRDWTENGWTSDVVHRLVPYLEDTARRVKGPAAARVLSAAARTREAIESGDANGAAAYCSLMILEALLGGYTPDAEKNEMDLLEHQWKVHKAHSKGVGKINAKYQSLSERAIAHAERIWAKDSGPECARIGDVAESFLLDLRRTGETATKGTVKGWLSKAEEQGRLTIPPAARRPGAQKKS